MTDARFPDRWLYDVRFHEISADDYRGYSFALMWSVANRTDGRITKARLGLIPLMTAECPARLVAAGLWVVQSDGWLIDGFRITQTTRSELETLDRARASEAEHKRLKRAADREAKARDDLAGQQGVGAEVDTDVDTDTDPFKLSGSIPDEPAGQQGVGADVPPDTPRTGQDRRFEEGPPSQLKGTRQHETLRLPTPPPASLPSRPPVQCRAGAGNGAPAGTAVVTCAEDYCSGVAEPGSDHCWRHGGDQ